jgi:putative IMPACT (imprinted ancient) family translation regulator
MQEIMARDLWNLLVMVVRYYGGTKLGTGGLVRAYSTAAKAVLDSCPQKEVACTLDGRVSYAYTDTGLVMHWLSRFRGTIVHQDCSGQGMIMTCQFPINDAPDAGQALIDMSGGRLRWEEGKG